MNALVAVALAAAERVTERSLESVARLGNVLVVDDRPEGLESDARAVCERLGLAYYRSPRRLGPARVANLAFLRARSTGCDAVLLCEAGVTVPASVVDALAAVAAAVAPPGGRIASVTAAPDDRALDQELVDWAAAQSESPAVDVPTPAGACVLYPVDAVRDVGLFDPIYRAGEDHLIDWAERARALGYRCVAAPAVYVSGTGLTRLVAAGGPVVRMRHAGYDAGRDAFLQSGALATAQERAARAVVVAAARRYGYTLEVGWPDGSDHGGEVRVVVRPDGARPVVSGHFWGFNAALALAPTTDVTEAVTELVGAEPRQVVISEKGRFAAQVAGTATRVADFLYPRRV